MCRVFDMRRALVTFTAAIMIFAVRTGARASDMLLYLEGQFIGGYSSADKGMLFYSREQEDVMQKPSVGFDYLQRFSGEGGDVAALALQARAAYDPRYDWYMEPQLYNAYVKVRTPGPWVWAGHNRPAFGLSSYFDSHALLLPALPMAGFSFDRDWGAGAYRDFDWGTAAASITTGTGMPVYFRNNFLAAGRVAWGTPEDIYTLGFSFGYGRTLETMGYHLMDGEPATFAMAGLDAALLIDRFENRMEAMIGKNRDEGSWALFWRTGVNFFEENRLKLEAQAMYYRYMGMTVLVVSAGPTVLVTADLSVRLMYEYSDAEDRHQAVGQLYYYRRI